MAMRRVLLAALAILCCSALAHADALSALGEAQATMALLPSVAGGLVVLIVGLRFSLNDFETGQVRKRTIVAIGLSLLIGVFMSLVDRDLNRSGTLFPNPWTDLYVPMAWGLWAAGRARRVADALVRFRATALVLAAALAGVGSTLELHCSEVVPIYNQQPAWLLAGFAALSGTWALVLYQYRGATAAINQPVAKFGWLLGIVPALAASYVFLLRLVVDTWHNWSHAAIIRSAGWAAAALTLLLYLGSGLAVYVLRWVFHLESPGYRQQ